MCGIAGYFGKGDVEQLHAMRKLLEHRGPDEWGIHYDDQAGLVHTRLSIIDLTGGKQPLKNTDGSIVVIFNGEIYNHQILRRDLEQKGYRLATHSDGEVISHLYQEHGINFVKKLRGMFSIALWDTRTQKMYLVRDRFGIKPLYYHLQNKTLYFASEIKALLACAPPNNVDFQALNWYLSFRYIPADRTGFENVYKVEPGHWLECSDKGIKVVKYWDIAETPLDHSQSEAQCIDAVREGLRDAIDMRLMSEVPVGAFLSGGLDSSFIVGLMSELNRFPVESFSFGVGDGWHNESDFAQMVAEYASTNHHPLGGNCNDEEVFKQVIWHLDEPLGDTAVIPTFLLSKLTKEYVTVSLMGEGADELLAGYDKYKAIKYGSMLGKCVPAWLARGMAPIFRPWEKAQRLLDFFAQKNDLAKAYVRFTSVFHENELKELLSPALRDQFSRTLPATDLISGILARVENRPIMDKLMYIDINTWLPNDVLLKADKMTMAHGLEGRVPFLDHIYAEKLFSIPDKFKLSKTREKAILRHAMKNHVPPEILKRRKHGFTVSLEPWKNPNNNLVRRILSEENVTRRGWFNYTYLDKLIKRPSNEEYTRRKVVSLLSLEMWAQTFLDQQSANPQARA